MITSVRKLLVFAAVGGLALAAMAANAGAGEVGAAPLTVVKTVSGPVPAGTTFTATIECPDENLLDGDGTVATVEFDADGQPTTADTVFFGGPGTCTVTETVTGGASSTTYSCAATVPEEPEVEVPSGFGDVGAQQDPSEVCPVAGPQAAPIDVNIEFEDQTATVTIANTFTTPTTPPIVPASQVVAQPAFTG